MNRRTVPNRRPPVPRRAFEGLLSVVALGVAFEWTRAADPEPWYADPAARALAGDPRPGDGPEFRPGPWHVPVAAGPADPVAVCSAAVTEWWAEASPRPSAAYRPAGDAVCVLPLPGRWVGDATRVGPGVGSPLLPAGDVFAVRPDAERSPAGEKSASDSGWPAAGRQPRDAVASVGELW